MSCPSRERGDDVTCSQIWRAPLPQALTFRATDIETKNSSRVRSPFSRTTDIRVLGSRAGDGRRFRTRAHTLQPEETIGKRERDRLTHVSRTWNSKGRRSRSNFTSTAATRRQTHSQMEEGRGRVAKKQLSNLFLFHVFLFLIVFPPTPFYSLSLTLFCSPLYCDLIPLCS